MVIRQLQPELQTVWQHYNLLQDKRPPHALQKSTEEELMWIMLCADDTLGCDDAAKVKSQSWTLHFWDLGTH